MKRIVVRIQQERPVELWNPRILCGAHLLELLIDWILSVKVFLVKEEKEMRKVISYMILHKETYR